MTDDDGRVTLFWEGVTTTDGRRIEIGAVDIPEGPFPIMRPHPDEHHASVIHGKGTDVRFEDNGRVTCKVDPPLADDEYLAVDLGALIGKNMGLNDDDPHTLVIRSARLMGATVVPGNRAVWPDQED